jgi:hypothetical protein
MKDFKSLPKMQCFKTGGSVAAFTKRDRKETGSADIAQDKKIVKKAFAMHDKQEHPGEKTDLSKLRKGGRAKKDCGTVKKYKAGGGVYGAKKTDADIKSIEKAKNFKPAMLCGGKSVKKYSGEYGSHVTPMEQQHSKDRYREKMRLSPSQQLELESQQAAAGAQFTKNEADRLNKVARGIGSKTSNMPNTDQMGNAYKKGGKIKKMNMGGSLKDVDAEENPGLAKLPTNVRNNMGYKRGGGKVKKMMTGGTCS